MSKHWKTCKVPNHVVFNVLTTRMSESIVEPVNGELLINFLVGVGDKVKPSFYVFA